MVLLRFFQVGIPGRVCCSTQMPCFKMHSISFISTLTIFCCDAMHLVRLCQYNKARRGLGMAKSHLCLQPFARMPAPDLKSCLRCSTQEDYMILY